jgi:tetratricopeptide (TPR) repeat protein
LVHSVAGNGPEVLAVADEFDDSLAVDVLERFAGTNGSSEAILAATKSLPFVLRVDDDRWSFQRGARNILILSLREQDELRFQEISTYLTELFEARAKQSAGRAAREALWYAAVHVLPLNADRAFDHLEEIAGLASGFNGSTDFDAVVSLVESEAELLEQRAAEVAYFRGRQAYALGKRQLAEEEFRCVRDASNRAGMRAIATHLLANILVDRVDGLLEAEVFARESLALHREVRAAHEVAYVEVTLARILLRDDAVDVPREARDMLDDATERLERVGDDRGMAMALMNRARYYMRAQSLGGAKDDALRAVKLTRPLRDRQPLLNALNTLALAQIRGGGRDNLRRAAQTVGEAQRLQQKLGDAGAEPFILHTRSLLAEAESDLPKARAYTREALELNEEFGLHWQAELMRKRLRKLGSGGGGSAKRKRRR